MDAELYKVGCTVSNMMRRTAVQKVWVFALLLLLIVSVAYSQYESLWLSPPDGSVSAHVGQLIFVFFIGGLVFMLVILTLILYFINKMS